MMADVKILIVEDELITVEVIRGVLEGRGYLVTGSADNGRKALELIEHERPDLILMDITIKGDIDGIELARIVGERHRIPVIYLTAFADRKTVDRAKQTESYGYIIKPFGETELLTNIEIALYKHSFDIKLKESEERYRTLFETMKDAMYIHDMDGRMIDFNPALEELLGFKRDELLGMIPPDVFANRLDLKPFIKTILKNGHIKDFETKFIRKDGSVINCLISANLEILSDGNKKIIRGIIRDITESEKTRRALQEEQDFTAAAIESLPSVFYAIDREGKFARWNRKLEDISGYSGDRLRGVSVFDLMNKENREIFEQKFKEGLSEGEMTLESRLSLASEGGVFRDFIITGRRVVIGGAEYIVGAGVDITERKRMEEALRESEHRYRAIFEGSLNLIYIYDFQGNFIDANDAALMLLGYAREDISSLSFRDLLSGEELERSKARIGNIIGSEDRSQIQEFNLKVKSGGYRCVEASASLLYREGKPYAILGIARDITERKKYIEELKSMHAENMYILNSITSLLIGVSTLDVITHWNYMAEHTFGIPASKALGEKITGFNIDWDWTEIYTGISSCIIEKGPVNLTDIKFKDKNGTEGLLGITINPIIGDNKTLRGFLIYGKDITERRLAEQQLLQSSKMASVGEMATGVAHELNQPLNVIKMASQFILDGIKEKYATEDFLRERVDKIIVQVDRAAHIINHLREFGRKSDYDFGMIDPHKPIRVAFDMLGEQLRLHSIIPVLELDTSLPSIRGDIHKLEQVFINMIVNAKDAFEEMKNSLQEKNILVKSYFKEQQGIIYIEFSDNGPGIPEEIRDRVFEPFFTTKEVGKGTGLGLSISYGIIKAHGGTIEVASNDRGTTFTISLPVEGGFHEAE